MIFVTGGTGLIGAHLLYKLALENRPIKALKRSSSNINHVKKIFAYYNNDADKLFKRIEWVEGDILDYNRIEFLLKDVEEIYHCAAIISFNQKRRKEMINNNRIGTANLVDAAVSNQVSKFCHVSSIAALGSNEKQGAVTEKSTLAPSKKTSGYGLSKFYSENEVWRAVQEGLDVVIVNPSVVLGPGFWESGSSQFFTTIWKEINFYTTGVTGYVGVKDVALAMIKLMSDENFESVKNQRFILNAENISYQVLFNQVADALDKKKPKNEAKKWMLEVAWRFERLKCWLIGGEPLFTKDIIKSSQSISNYDGSKITRQIGFQYTPISTVIEEIAKFFKSDKK